MAVGTGASNRQPETANLPFWRKGRKIRLLRPRLLLLGKLAAHAAAGFGIGLAGSAVYVAARKGREVYLPAETPMLVRMDSTVAVPSFNRETSGTASGH